MTKDEITRALRICGNSRKCTECPLGYVEFCLHIMTTCSADDMRDGNTIKLPREQEENEWND